MTEQPVSEIMTREVVTVGPQDDVKDVATLMADRKIGGVPVLDGKKIVGLVTEDDLIMKDVKIHFPTFIHLLSGFIYLESVKRFDEQFKKMVAAKASDVMTTDVVTISINATVSDAATIMVDKKLDRLPVVDDEGELVGMVTKADIVKAIASESV